MSSATLRIRVPPCRMLSPRDAAEYCGLPVKRFRILCNVAPVQLPNGEIAYDIRDLDQWIDNLKSTAPDGHDDILRKLGT